MAATTFVDNQTPVLATWLNSVDALLVDVFQEAGTASEARTAISVYSQAQIDAVLALQDDASEITFTPTGDISATDVQAAIAELDTEKQSVAGMTAYVTYAQTDASTLGWFVDEDNMSSDSATKVPSQQSVKAYVDAAVVGLMDYKGGYDASTNSPDLDTTPSGILKGDVYTVTVAGTFFTEDVEVGDMLFANQDSPTTLSHWTRVQYNTTPSTLLTMIKTVDGSGSGLDADLLDTYEASAFPRKAETATITAAWTMAAINMADSLLTRPVLKDYAIEHTAPSISAGAITFDCANGNSFAVSVNANITSITLSNPPASGDYGEIVIAFAQTASYTIAGWPAAVKWPGGAAPALTTGAGALDYVTLRTYDGGTTWYGDFSQDYS